LFLKSRRQHDQLPRLIEEQHRKSRSKCFTRNSKISAVSFVTNFPGIRVPNSRSRPIKTWTLYENQHPSLKRFYPVKRPKVQQSFDRLEFGDGGMLVALPGKDPDKIRGEHPSILFMDEACFIDNGGEAFDIALASRVPKVLLVSTAAPSWIRRLTKNATPLPLYE
jgi:hypothetical protein